jgi:hypothetical protein
MITILVEKYSVMWRGKTFKVNNFYNCLNKDMLQVRRLNLWHFVTSDVQ